MDFAERAARNEAAFRSVNEQIEKATDRHGRGVEKFGEARAEIERGGKP